MRKKMFSETELNAMADDEIVDALLDEEDMVIKSLPPHMKNIRLVFGVAITGRNEVINILHVPGLIMEAGETKCAHVSAKKEADAMRILVVDDSANTREIERCDFRICSRNRRTLRKLWKGYLPRWPVSTVVSLLTTSRCLL